MAQQAYAFKWSNYNLDDYIKERRSGAAQKRREAEILQKQSDIIDVEAEALEIALIPFSLENSHD